MSVSIQDRCWFDSLGATWRSATHLQIATHAEIIGTAGDGELAPKLQIGHFGVG
jgi:hypothetical protein